MKKTMLAIACCWLAVATLKAQTLVNGMQTNFSTKELEIIRLICHELSSKEIASQLNINCRTVESARERIQEKIGARNMVGIALYAIKNGIFTS